MANFFPRTSAEINIAEMRTVPIGDYERIKAKIDRGINRQVEGDKEVEEGLLEMVETKAYLKKYKSIAAFAEHEYGKSRRWISDRIREHLLAIEENKAPGGNSPPEADTKAEQESETLNQSEPEKPEAEATPKQNGEPTERVDNRIRDETGWPIPQGCLELWNKREEVQPLMTCASKLKCFLEPLGNQQLTGGLWAPLEGQARTFYESANRIYAYLDDCKPYAVCPNCDGTKRDNGKSCVICHARGLVSKAAWTRTWTSMGFSDAEKEALIAKRQRKV